MLLIIVCFFLSSAEGLPTAGLPCQKVTFAEHYAFIWEDDNIEGVNVTVFLGSLCDGGIVTFLLHVFYLLFFFLSVQIL